MNLLQRLDRLVRSYSSDSSEAHTDEFRSAWEELERFIADDQPSCSGVSPTSTESIERDFAALEIPPNSRMEDVRKAYRKQVSQFHPDLYTHDPQKERAAAELTRKLTASFDRIRAHCDEKERG